MAPSEYDPLLDAPKKARPARIRDTLGQTHFLASWFGPTLLFFVTSWIWTWRFLSAPTFCIFWSITVCFIITSALVLVTPAFKTKHRWFTTVCFLSYPAIVLGSFIGLYLYDECAIFPQFYANTRKYTNVVPAQPAAAVSDAGKIVFSQETFVDVSQSVGLIEETGVKYCVAPIRDGSGIDRIEFWAAGIGCCGASGDFYCDAAADSEAKAGIVIFDNNGYFEEARYDLYEKARQKAQAEFSLQSVTNPIYVRWVKESNLDMLSRSYTVQAMLLELLALVIYGAMSLAIAWTLWEAKPSQP